MNATQVHVLALLNGTLAVLIYTSPYEDRSGVGLVLIHHNIMIAGKTLFHLTVQIHNIFELVEYILIILFEPTLTS